MSYLFISPKFTDDKFSHLANLVDFVFPSKCKKISFDFNLIEDIKNEVRNSSICIIPYDKNDNEMYYNLGLLSGMEKNVLITYINQNIEINKNYGYYLGDKNYDLLFEKLRILLPLIEKGDFSSIWYNLANMTFNDMVKHGNLKIKKVDRNTFLSNIQRYENPLYLPNSEIIKLSLHKIIENSNSHIEEMLKYMKNKLKDEVVNQYNIGNVDTFNNLDINYPSNSKSKKSFFRRLFN